MIFVPMGYSLGPDMFGLDDVRAGSAWGAGTFAGADGARQPSATELAYAKHQARGAELGQRRCLVSVGRRTVPLPAALCFPAEGDVATPADCLLHTML